MKSFDMMVAKRIHSDSSSLQKRSCILETMFFSKFVNINFGNDVTDIFSGFRIFQKDLLKLFLKIHQNLRLRLS